MNSDALVSALAERIFGWKATPDRFVKSGRSWIPRWRFNPLRDLEDAFTVLDQAGGAYTLSLDPHGTFKAEVRIGSRVGTVIGELRPQTITLAVAQALGVEVTE